MELVKEPAYVNAIVAMRVKTATYVKTIIIPYLKMTFFHVKNVINPAKADALVLDQ